VDPSRRPRIQYCRVVACLALVVAAGVVWAIARPAQVASPPADLGDCNVTADAQSCAVTLPVAPGPAEPFATPDAFGAAKAQLDEARRSGRPAVALFTRDLCRNCEMMKATLRWVRIDFENEVTFLEVNVDDSANLSLVQEAQVRAVPSFLFLSPSGAAKQIDHSIRAADLRAEIEALLAREPEAP
jgi:thiol-disulfide isomerase/thioredoxin